MYPFFEILGLKISAYSVMAVIGGLFVALFAYLRLRGKNKDWQEVFYFITYGFGQLVENSDILVQQGNKPPVTTTNTNNISTSQTVQGEHMWRCEGCGNMISQEICPVCNKEKLENLKKWKEQGLITEEEYVQKLESLKHV